MRHPVVVQGPATECDAGPRADPAPPRLLLLRLEGGVGMSFLCSSRKVTLRPLPRAAKRANSRPQCARPFCALPVPGTVSPRHDRCVTSVRSRAWFGRRDGAKGVQRTRRRLPLRRPATPRARSRPAANRASPAPGPAPRPTTPAQRPVPPRGQPGRSSVSPRARARALSHKRQSVRATRRAGPFSPTAPRATQIVCRSGDMRLAALPRDARGSPLRAVP